MDTSIELEFGDGKYRFWIGLPQQLAIEKGERHIGQIWADLDSAMEYRSDGETVTPIFIGRGTWRVRDIIDVIRFGLIGGGEGMVNGEKVEVSAIDATRLVETYVHNRPIAETLPVAEVILRALIHGVRLKKKAELEKGPPRSAKVKSSRTAESSA